MTVIASFVGSFIGCMVSYWVQDWYEARTKCHYCKSKIRFGFKAPAICSLCGVQIQKIRGAISDELAKYASSQVAASNGDSKAIN